MIVRVAERARKAKLIDRVIVATDDVRIQKVVEDAGFEVRMTSPECASGTDRVAAAVRGLDPTLVVNVQGDEPLIDPRDIDVLVEATYKAKTPMGTLAREMPSPEAFASRTVVKVVTALDGSALYFSRAPMALGAMHIGLYAYTPEALDRLSKLPRTPLEIAESLEQLRALEHGIAIQVARCVSERPTHAIDVPEDVAKVLALLERP